VQDETYCSTAKGDFLWNLLLEARRVPKAPPTSGARLAECSLLCPCCLNPLAYRLRFILSHRHHQTEDGLTHACRGIDLILDTHQDCSSCLQLGSDKKGRRDSAGKPVKLPNADGIKPTITESRPHPLELWSFNSAVVGTCIAVHELDNHFVPTVLDVLPAGVELALDRAGVPIPVE
jgi:hypothetical protein